MVTDADPGIFSETRRDPHSTAHLDSVALHRRAHSVRGQGPPRHHAHRRRSVYALPFLFPRAHSTGSDGHVDCFRPAAFLAAR